ncbi:DUF3379 domain-containing protein [Vibrio agarivorans]|uniref:DUF3379 domain-containing protein n=1 Tax=Vibrio agarivorans TaxID=153622 RepID=UPI0022304C2C|nr:DUF3379 domain-containing protein [Vibrio agarivorans]
MDELEFRRRVLTEPNVRDVDIMEATRNSESNAKFLDDVLELDKQISDTMNVDVPDDLAERILLNQALEEETKVVRPTFTKCMVSMAASVAFMAGLLAGQINWGNVFVPQAQASLSQTALAYFYGEKDFIASLDESSSVEQINAKLVPFHYQVDRQFPYHVYYLNHCSFGTSNAFHAVLKGEHGRVTVFITNQPGTSEDFKDDKMKGMVVPLENSSMIIVAHLGEDVAKIAENIEYILKPM